MRRKLLNGRIMAVLAVILAVFLSVGVAEEQTDANGPWGYDAEKAGTMYGERIRPAIDALTQHWKEVYADKNSADLGMTVDGYLEIKNTRIIFWKENATTEHLPDLVENVAYVVENPYSQAFE